MNGETHAHICTRCDRPFRHRPGTAVPPGFKDTPVGEILRLFHKDYGTCTRCLGKRGLEIVQSNELATLVRLIKEAA